MDSSGGSERFDIIAIQKGDKRVFEKVIDLYYNDVYFYAKSMCRDELLAKDLVQEVFFGLWEKRQKLPIDTVLKGWFYKSVKHKYLGHVKKYRKEAYVFERAFSETIDTIVQEEHQDILAEKLALLEREIQLLPKKCKQILIMSKKEGLTNAEIADYLNISVKTVEGHIANAYKTLKEKLYEKFQMASALYPFEGDLNLIAYKMKKIKAA